MISINLKHKRNLSDFMQTESNTECIDTDNSGLIMLPFYVPTLIDSSYDDLAGSTIETGLSSTSARDKLNAAFEGSR